jgi:hypothetical protein
VLAGALGVGVEPVGEALPRRPKNRNPPKRSSSTPAPIARIGIGRPPEVATPAGGVGVGEPVEAGVDELETTEGADVGPGDGTGVGVGATVDAKPGRNT